MAEAQVRTVRRRPIMLVAGFLAVVAAAVAALVALPQEGEAQKRSADAKNVIFMMGDGMGPAQRDAIQLATVGPYARLNMDKLPYTGMVGTNSADPDGLVTDSAAAATAMGTGVKTYNGAIGVDKDGNEVPDIIEQAKAAGKSVGLVTTSQVTDASPAGFAAHVDDRSKQSEIARQYIKSTKVDVILGGGEDYWYPAGDAGAFPDNPPEDPSEGSKGTEGNLVDGARQAGYEYVTNQRELKNADGKKVLGLFANEEMFQQKPEPDGVYDPTVPLTVMTQKAIDLLSRDPDGFFLFVEEEGVDEMGGQNNAALTLKSGQALDAAVKAADGFAGKKTLLIAAADHESGGLTVEAPDNSDESGGLSPEDGPFDAANSDYQFTMDWTTTGHTAVDVPLAAEGPGADDLTGKYENTEIYRVMAKTLGVGRN